MPELLPCHRGGHRARDGRRDIDVVERERASPAIERLEDAQRTRRSDDRDREQRRRHIAGSFGDRPLEPGVGRDVRDGERLAGRERVPREPGLRIDRDTDDVAGRRTGRGAKGQSLGG